MPLNHLILLPKVIIERTLSIKSTLTTKVSIPIDECPSTTKPLNFPVQFNRRMDHINEKHLNNKSYQYNG